MIGSHETVGRSSAATEQDHDAIRGIDVRGTGSLDAQLAEERRLFYVAATRARQRLVVTAVAGDEEQPSRLLDELDPIGDDTSRTPAEPIRGVHLPGLVAELRAQSEVGDWQREQDRKMHRILDQLQDLPGITLGIDPDPSGNPFSRARLTVDPARAGLTAAAVCEALRQGDPAIHPRAHHVDEGYFTLDAIEVTDEEIDLICARLRAILRQ